MNKLFTKIAALALGMTMAIGVGVAVGTSSKSVEQVNATDITDAITSSDLAATNTTYKDFSGVTITSDAVYAGNSAKSSAGGIQMRSKNSNSGIVSTTSGGKVNSVTITVESGSNTIDVYGKNSAYSSARDLYDSSNQGTKVGSVTATGTITFTDEYEYVGIRSNNGAVYVTSVEIVWTTSSQSPSIALSGSSFTGYTGQSFSVTATYSNLTSDFAWATSGSGTTTETITSTGSTTNGTSTYSGTLTGAGTKTLSATGGGATSQSYTIGITQTTVDIVKASTSIGIGNSETLAVNHNASAVDGLTWGSNNAKVSVDSNGKVTVANDATVGMTATITATSKVDTSVSDTCAVTVKESSLDTTYDFVTNFANYNDGWTNSYATHEGIGGKTQVGGAYDATIDLYYASKQASTISDRPVFATKTAAGSWTKIIGFTLTESNYNIADVEVTFSQWGSKTPDIALFSGDEASGTPLDSGTIGTKNAVSTTGLNAKQFTVGYCDKNTGSNVQGGLTSIYISLVKENALDHVTVSFDDDPADRTFTAGSNFAFNGELIASYTVDSPKAVTPSGYYLGGEEGTGTAITTSDILNVADHNGADVYVQYKEGGITKYDSFTLIVNAAPATSVTLSTSSGTVSLNQYFEVSSITATVNPQAYATQGVTWEVYDAGGLVKDETYTFDGAQFRATQTADVVFHVKSTATPSVYAPFTLTITGNPIAHLLDSGDLDVTDGSTSVFADAGTITYHVTTENFEGTMTYTWSSSNTSVISINDDQDTSCGFYVEGTAGSARLSCRIQGSVKGDVTVYIDVTVSAVTVTSVTWTAPTINVYSGSKLSSTAGWNVKYRTNSDPEHDKDADSFKVLLNGSEISLPYTWNAADDGNTLGVQVGGVNSSTTTVSVTQRLRPVMAPVSGDSTTSTLTFTKKYSEGGATSSGGEEWVVDSDGQESTFDSTKGIHYGTSSGSVQYITLTTNDFPAGTVSKIVVNASTASGVSATVGVTVGGNQFGGEPQSLTTSAANYTFNGDLDTGKIVVTITKPSKATKAIYCLSVAVTYAPNSGEEVDIANATGHEAAQKAVVKFAKAFNTALGATQKCTTGLAAAWSTATSAWGTFLNETAALGETEEAYAKKLIKNATAQWTENTDENYEYCLERAMATYEYCVKNHEGCNKFMDGVRPVGRTHTNPISILGIANNSNAIAIVAIVSVVSLTAIGGYFFLRKRREEN